MPPESNRTSSPRIARPRLDDLLRRKLGKFSLDASVDLARAAGLTLTIGVVDAA